MSSKVTNYGRAETAFREAFERLRTGQTHIVEKGARITQNNVAREAGVDPSALKKARFPSLIEEIQRWSATHGNDESPSPSQINTRQRRRNRDLRERLEAIKLQRDQALGMLVDADAKILELTIENERLKALATKSNVTSLTTMIRGS